MKSILDIGLTNALIASLLAIAAAVAGRFQSRPALRHGLWMLVLLKLIAPPLWPVHFQIPTRAVPIVEEVADLDGGSESPAHTFVELGPIASSSPEPAGWRGLKVLPGPRMADAQADGATGVPLGPATPIVSWRMIVSIVWLGGSIVWLSVALIRIERFRRVLRMATPADETILEHVREIAARIGLRWIPRTVMTPGTVSPLVWGFAIVPKLVIPTALWARLDHGQRTTLLIHELAHLRRGDHLVRWLELVATALYWWHPVVWLARRAIREAEEQCCDAWVVWAEPKAARSYANALLETVEFLSQSPGRPFAATGLGRVDHLKRRLTMILRGATPRGLSWQGGLTILGLAGVLLPLSPIAAQEEAKPEPHQYIKRLDVIPTVTGEVTIQEAAPTPEKRTENVKAPAVKNGHVVTVEEYKELCAKLSAVQMERIEAEVRLRVAQENLKKIQAKIAQAAEPTTDETDAAKAAELTVGELQSRLQMILRAEANIKAHQESIAGLLLRVEHQHTHAGEIERANAEVGDAQRRLDDAILRQAEAQGLKKPGPAEVTTTSQTDIQNKDGSRVSIARFGFGARPVPKMSRTAQLVGPNGRLIDALKTDRIITTDSMVLINKDGTTTVYSAVEGEHGGKPRLRIRTLSRADGAQIGEPNIPDGANFDLKKTPTPADPTFLVPADGESIIVSPEEQSLQEQEAEAREILEKTSRMVRNKSSDPAMRHRRAELAEIQAKLRAIHAPKPDPDQRIDALEKKLDSVLDELKHLKGDDER